MVWHKSFSDELVRLAQSVYNRVSGWNTILFVPKSQLPQDWNVTYWRIVCDIKPQKSVTQKIRLTVRGNLIDYPGEIATPSVYITWAKTLVNSTVSTPDAIFVCVDISIFSSQHTNAPLKYINLPFDITTQDIIKRI